LAAEGSNKGLLQKIWDFVKDNLTTEEIKNIVLLATDRDGDTAWHLVAEGSNKDLLQKIWDFAQDILTAEEIKYMFFLATDSNGNIA